MPDTTPDDSPDQAWLPTLLALLQMDHLPNEDIDSLAVRRDLAAASVAGLGDFWDNEVDLEWQGSP